MGVVAVRVRMFTRQPLAPGAVGPSRWVSYSTYSGSLENCIDWLPQDGHAKLGEEFLLVEVDVMQQDEISKVATVRIEEPPKRLVAVRT